MNETTKWNWQNSIVKTKKQNETINSSSNTQNIFKFRKFIDNGPTKTNTNICFFFFLLLFVLCLLHHIENWTTWREKWERKIICEKKEKISSWNEKRQWANEGRIELKNGLIENIANERGLKR